MNKIVINSHQKLFVTNDASTIVNELDIFHPAAKLVVMNSKRQESEVRKYIVLIYKLCSVFLHFFFLFRWAILQT